MRLLNLWERILRIVSLDYSDLQDGYFKKQHMMCTLEDGYFYKITVILQRAK